MHTAVTTAVPENSAAILRVGAVQLLFSQAEIRTLETVSDVDTSMPSAGSVGWISFLRQRWPVYAVDESLILQSKISPGSRTCVLFPLERGYAGLLCDDVTIVKKLAGKASPLPIAMRGREMPIHALQIIDGKLVALSTARLIMEFVERQLLGEVADNVQG